MNGVSRACGACSMCCKVIRIVELEKPAGAWCRHAAPGRGCRIYAGRPTPCRVFQCLWLQEPQTTEALKPDRAKVVLASNPTNLVAHCDPADPTAWRREPMYGFLKRQAWSGAAAQRPVLAVAGRRIWLITPDADHDLGEADVSRPFRIAPGLDGKPRLRPTPETEPPPAARAG